MRRKSNIIATLLTLITAVLVTAEGSVLAFAIPQSGTYKVSGDAGRKWIDTGIDLKSGQMVYLSAQGEVSYGQNAGTWGPEGTTQSILSGSGYPSETTRRYALVARVTSSRTNPNDDLREDHGYTDEREFCARTNGHLWLTANDNEPEDNKGEYIVSLKVGTCSPSLAPAQPPDLGRGVFRVKIVGFRVEHVVHDGILDAGDDVYIMWDADEFNRDGRLARGHLAGQTLVYGDTGRARTQVRAGTQGSNGGLKNGDTIIERSAVASVNRLPMLVGDFELVDGANAVLFAPTIWLATNSPGNYPGMYRQRYASSARLASYDVRESLERGRAFFRWTSSGYNSPQDWFEMVMSTQSETDRPIGAVVPTELWSFYAPTVTLLTPAYEFKPFTFLLTYQNVNELIRDAGGRQDWAEFQCSYSGTHERFQHNERYQLLMTIERRR